MANTREFPQLLQNSIIAVEKQSSPDGFLEEAKRLDKTLTSPETIDQAIAQIKQNQELAQRIAKINERRVDIMVNTLTNYVSGEFTKASLEDLTNPNNYESNSPFNPAKNMIELNEIRLPMFVKQEILSIHNPELRTMEMERWVFAAQECINRDNIMVGKAIYLGLNDINISRLLEGKLSSQAINAFNETNKFLEDDKKVSAYLSNTIGPIFPSIVSAFAAASRKLGGSLDLLNKTDATIAQREYSEACASLYKGQITDRDYKSTINGAEVSKNLQNNIEQDKTLSEFVKNCREVAFLKRNITKYEGKISDIQSAIHELQSRPKDDENQLLKETQKREAELKAEKQHFEKAIEKANELLNDPQSKKNNVETAENNKYKSYKNAESKYVKKEVALVLPSEITQKLKKLNEYVSSLPDDRLGKRRKEKIAGFLSNSSKFYKANLNGLSQVIKDIESLKKELREHHRSVGGSFKRMIGRDTTINKHLTELQAVLENLRLSQLKIEAEKLSKLDVQSRSSQLESTTANKQPHPPRYPKGLKPHPPKEPKPSSMSQQDGQSSTAETKLASRREEFNTAVEHIIKESEFNADFDHMLQESKFDAELDRMLQAFEFNEEREPTPQAFDFDAEYERMLQESLQEPWVDAELDQMLKEFDDEDKINHAFDSELKELEEEAADRQILNNAIQEFKDEADKRKFKRAFEELVENKEDHQKNLSVQNVKAEKQSSSTILSPPKQHHFSITTPEPQRHIVDTSAPKAQQAVVLSSNKAQTDTHEPKQDSTTYLTKTFAQQNSQTIQGILRQKTEPHVKNQPENKTQSTHTVKELRAKFEPPKANDQEKAGPELNNTPRFRR